MAKLVALCVSEKRGTKKKCIDKGLLIANYGIDGDAHAGNWHRQVSLLSLEKIEEFKAKGADVSYGDFGENMVVSGIDLRKCAVGTRLQIGDAVLELTQIGKECHSHCTIYQSMGECIMPNEGVFAKVVKGGEVKLADAIIVMDREVFPYQAAVITLSDKGYSGEREDISGPTIENRLLESGYEVVERILIPDDFDMLAKELKRLADYRKLDLILTTGGTGFSSRDITPEATISVAERIAPGIAEAIRAESMKITKNAMLSRGVSVIRDKTLIINLPGSPKACMESMDVFMDTIPHGLDLLRGSVNECGRT